MRRTRGWIAGALVTVGALSATTEAQAGDYVLFESGQVRPLALSPDGKRLYAVNTPDNRLEIFKVKKGRLEHLDSVAVGLEPVAVAVHGNDEVWVVNHLSDSISIVDVKGQPQVVRTLLVGDEPRDIVFAGPGRDRAFVTVAHRGQNLPFDPQLTTPGVGRADVWVYDADDLGDDINGGPLGIVNLFTDSPRALAVTPDGETVYAAGFNTGNQTTVLTEFVQPPMPPPTTTFEGIAAFTTGLMLKYDGAHWVDELNRPWDFLVNFNLPDKDVFAIDAMANPPHEIAGSAYASVGTTLYGMVVNPANGNVYVSNTDASNHQRFEGTGDFAGHTVRGQHNKNRITVLDQVGAVPHHLNPHIDYSDCCGPVSDPESILSVALPTGMAVSSDGQTLYTAMLGSGKVAVYDTQELESDTFEPSLDDQVLLSGGGPTGLVLDEGRHQLYVMTRFDNAISVIKTTDLTEVDHVPMFNPEPDSVLNGRRFLYDATLSSHGDSACATCHVFGDKDDLAWDLGNPDGHVLPNNNQFTAFNLAPVTDPVFHPMKGPLTTQSLRGMDNHGPMHWRGDRTGSFDEPNVQPDSGAFDEREAFRQFQAGFTDLIGRPDELPEEDMEAFTDFILQLMYPPNPIRNLDDSLTPDQQFGQDFFFNRTSEAGATTCNSCHTLNPDGNAEFGVERPGFFGTSGLQSREVFPQDFKVPHLRNLYTKVGMFGFPNLDPLIEAIPGQTGYMGDQIRGFGVSRAGDIDSVFRFLHVTTFSTNFLFGPNPDGFPAGAAGDPERRKVESFLLAFDTNHKPIVGQQYTLDKHNGAVAIPRIGLLVDRAEAGDCELVAKGRLGGRNRERGYLYLGSGYFQRDRSSAPPISYAALVSKVDHNRESLTFTCAPLGTGERIGIDRDADGVLDGDDCDDEDDDE
ncbi:MAG: beta-propeller fold lactonase family protein [Polyangiaceae bacterium]|nr:beta-propeller fold lactonase family protein [Polyangiaceae bacterium]